MPKTNEYIFLDLESLGSNYNDDFREIIEIGAKKVKYNNKNYEVVDSFHSYISPVFHRLNKKVSKLTGISKDDLKTGKEYEEAMNDLFQWAGKDATFVTWSRHDEKMIEENNNALYLYDLPELHSLDLQRIYDTKNNKSHCTNLKNALEELGETFVGQEHSALDDANNMIIIFDKLKVGKK